MVPSNLEAPVGGEEAFHEIQTPSPAITAQNAWRKIDFFLLPILVVFYVLDILDITNLSNARIAGIQTDMNMSDSQFSMIATVASIAHLFSSFPLSIALRILGPHIVLPTLMTLWGIVTALQGRVPRASVVTHSH
ncbi:hypothetical protein H0H93_008884 [Arthromyces matolae]|nr:hypothetical protein H0H93_008884 [Arthromyces matolae]